MLTAQALADWLKTRGVTVPSSTEGYTPKVPGKLILITATGGPGEQAERTRDVLSFQVISRGSQARGGSGTDGEALAWQVDDAILGAVPPLQIDGTRVIRTLRQGGPPSFIQRDNAGRAHYSCNYLFEVARGKF